ncbi:MAG: hypothetical protein R3211_04305 [Balneolaceae bacterium]|nr:hypothetical protein [Balneolaceae bacterium]
MEQKQRSLKFDGVKRNRMEVPERYATRGEVRGYCREISKMPRPDFDKKVEEIRIVYDTTR